MAAAIKLFVNSLLFFPHVVYVEVSACDSICYILYLICYLLFSVCILSLLELKRRGKADYTMTVGTIIENSIIEDFSSVSFQTHALNSRLETGESRLKKQDPTCIFHKVKLRGFLPAFYIPTKFNIKPAVEKYNAVRDSHMLGS